MDAAQALADLTEISSQIQAAVLFDEDGDVQGSTLGSDAAATALAQAGAALLERAGAFRSGGGRVTQLEASTAAGSVFVVGDGDAAHRGDDRPLADGRARLLRPQELPPGRRVGPREAEAAAQEEGRR